MAYLAADLPSSPEFDPTTLAMPPTSVIYRSIRCAHIPGKQDTYPLWVVSYLVELRLVQDYRQLWDSAVHALETRIQRKKSDELGPNTLDRAEIDQMLELLDNNSELQNRSIRVVPSGHAREIIQIHQNDGLEYETSPKYRKLRELGEDIANGGEKQLATVANVGGDHWIALIVDFTSKAVKPTTGGSGSIIYSTEFGWVTLPCLRQRDGHNCGLFAANRVAYYIDPNTNPLSDPQRCDDERLMTVAKILDRHDVNTLPQAANAGFSFTFRFDIAGNDCESVDGEEDDEPRTPISTPPASPKILPVSPMKGSVKRALSDRAAGSPPTSPVKKRSSAAKGKGTAALAEGLKVMGAVSPNKRTVLFKFFSKETEQEKRKREAREKEEADLKAEQRAERELHKIQDQIVAVDEKRDGAKKRKREQRERKYLAEKEAGIRNDDFTLKEPKKRKVELRDEPNESNMAEVTRPARQIEQRYKDKHRTHTTGRKKVHEPHERVYKNWKTPVLFAMILEAGRKTKTARGL
ncbi:hypothetical protein B0H13DRAFT_1895135 [Mycena leptocephala]|nr:hypothetical protein B0H13DRAFT_1895135 [Mycena leptocephala]